MKKFIITAFLVLLSLTVILNPVIASEEVKFSGKFVDYFPDAGPIVKVENVHFGDLQEGIIVLIPVITGLGSGGCPDKLPQSAGNDKVEVYGVKSVNPARDPAIFVDVCPSDYYVKKIEARDGDIEVDVTMDKDTYRVGETATISLRFPGRGDFVLRQTQPTRELITRGHAREGIEKIRGTIEEPTGRKRLEVRFRDRHGNTATDTTTYVVEESHNEDIEVDIRMDKDTYRVGELATIQLLFPSKGEYTLLQTRPKRRMIVNGPAREGVSKMSEIIEGPPGRKMLEVRFRDRHGNTATASTTFVVEKKKAQPPRAVCDASPTSPEVNERVRFDASGSQSPDGRIVEYRWDLTGDGRTDQGGRTVYKSFSRPGSREVTVTVEDDHGGTDTATCSVRVQESEAQLRVTVEDQDGDPLDARLYLEDSYKGSTGSMTFDELEPGSYRIEATKEDYESDQKTVRLDAGDRKEVTLMLKEEEPAATELQLDQVEQEGQKVTFEGHLLKKPATPLEGKEIKLTEVDPHLDEDTAELLSSQLQLATTETDSYGRFSIEWEIEEKLDEPLQVRLTFGGTDSLEAARAPEDPYVIEPEPAEPKLIDTVVNPNQVEIGGTIELTYKIENLSSESKEIGLGATIKAEFSPHEYWSDPDSDKVVHVPAGETVTVTREFVVPNEAPSGDYEVVFAIWPGKPGSKGKEDFDRVRRGWQLEVIPPVATPTELRLEESQVDREDRSVTFKGTLTKQEGSIPLEDKRVKVVEVDNGEDDLRDPDSYRQVLATTRTGSEGGFTLTWQPREGGPEDETQKVRILFEGTDSLGFSYYPSKGYHEIEIWPEISLPDQSLLIETPSYNHNKEVNPEGDGESVLKFDPPEGQLRLATVFLVGLKNGPLSELVDLAIPSIYHEDEETVKGYYGLILSPDRLEGPGTYQVSIPLDYKHLQVSVGFARLDIFRYSADFAAYRSDEYDSPLEKLHSKPIKEKESLLGSSIWESLKAAADEALQGLLTLTEVLIKHYTWDTPKTMTVDFQVEVEEDTYLWFGAELNQKVFVNETPNPRPGGSIGFAGLDLTIGEVRIQKVGES